MKEFDDLLGAVTYLVETDPMTYKWVLEEAEMAADALDDRHLPYRSRLKGNGRTK